MDLEVFKRDIRIGISIGPIGHSMTSDNPARLLHLPCAYASVTLTKSPPIQPINCMLPFLFNNFGGLGI